MFNLINFEIFAASSQNFLLHIIDLGLSGGSFLIVTVILFIKWLGIKGRDYGANYINKKFTLLKKINSAVGVVGEDLKNILYGLIGMAFSWEIVIIFFDVLKEFLKNIESGADIKKITILQSQIEFANSINQFISYLGIIEVTSIFIAFMMLSLAFLGGIFKISAKIIGAGAIILAIGSIFIGYYADTIIEIAGAN